MRQTPELSITDHMRESMWYRAALCVSMMLQLGAWLLFLKTSLWGLALGSIAAVAWLGLTLWLDGIIHHTWTGLFVLSFSGMAFALLPLLQDQRMVMMVWWFGFGTLLVSILYALACFVRGYTQRFAIAEHVAFMCYHLTFILFFIVSQHRS
jgi:hypothetical protein